MKPNQMEASFGVKDFLMHCPLQRNSRPFGAEMETERAASSGSKQGCKPEKRGEATVGHTSGTVEHTPGRSGKG